MRNPHLCSLLCCPVPCHVDVTPVLCISASAASPYVRVCFVSSNACFSLYGYLYCYYFCPFISTFSRVFSVVVAPPAGHINAFFSSSVSLLSSFILLFFFLPSVWSCRAFLLLIRSPRHIIGLIVPGNNNLVPSGLGLRHARMHEVFCFVSFLFYSFLLGPFCSFMPVFVQ